LSLPPLGQSTDPLSPDGWTPDDLCHFDTELKKLAFFEVKRKDNARLLKPQERPEVLDQLAVYCGRLRDYRADLLSTYRQMVAWKRELGPRGADRSWSAGMTFLGKAIGRSNAVCHPSFPGQVRTVNGNDGGFRENGLQLSQCDVVLFRSEYWSNQNLFRSEKVRVTPDSGGDAGPGLLFVKVRDGFDDQLVPKEHFEETSPKTWIDFGVIVRKDAVLVDESDHGIRMAEGIVWFLRDDNQFIHLQQLSELVTKVGPVPARILLVYFLGDDGFVPRRNDVTTVQVDP